jgi:hypothetical protein
MQSSRYLLFSQRLPQPTRRPISKASIITKWGDYMHASRSRGIHPLPVGSTSLALQSHQNASSLCTSDHPSMMPRALTFFHNVDTKQWPVQAPKQANREKKENTRGRTTQQTRTVQTTADRGNAMERASLHLAAVPAPKQQTTSQTESHGTYTRKKDIEPHGEPRQTHVTPATVSLPAAARRGP